MKRPLPLNGTGVITAAVLTNWQDDVDSLRDKDQVSATICSFLFTATTS